MFSITGALAAIPYIATVVAAGLLWNLFIENPGIRREAREGYVTLAELSAAKAQLAEQERQAQAALAANGRFSEMLRQQAAELEKQAQAAEKELEDYEAELKRKGRACYLDADDIRGMRQ